MLLRHHLLSLLVLLLLVTGPAQAQSQVWAIVVGIDEYVRPSIPRLRYAVADAKLFSQALQDTLKVPKDHIFLMTSDAVDENSQPRFVNVAYRLSFLKGKVKKDDTLIFYFAGHGVTLDGEPFLLTEEADNRSALTLKASSLHGGDLITTLRKSESGNVWVMLDACRNSPNEKGESKLDPAVSGALSQANVGLLQTATMFSCKVGERAWEWDEKKHGCYSYFLVEGLRREAADSLGRVTLQALADYISVQVPAISKRFGSTQNPTMFYGGPTAGQWVLATLPSTPGGAVGKKDAETSRYVAQLEALQARLDNETALRVKAEQRAKVAESQRQELEQELAVMEKQISGKVGKAGVTAPIQPNALAYSDESSSRALQSEISRLREENETLRRRLTTLESEATKVGMAPRAVMLESQPMLHNVWASATLVEIQADKDLGASTDLKRSLQLCLSAREALAKKVTVFRACYAAALDQRPLTPAAKQDLLVMKERLSVQRLLNEVYQARLEAADAATKEAERRLEESLAREDKYRIIIGGLQGELAAAEKKLVGVEAELATAQGALSVANLKLRKWQDKADRQKRGANQRSPELEKYTRSLDHYLEDQRNTDSIEARPEDYKPDPPARQATP